MATKATAYVAGEKTKEGVNRVAVSESASAGWKSLSEAASHAAEYAQDQYHDQMHSQNNDGHSHAEYALIGVDSTPAIALRSHLSVMVKTFGGALFRHVTWMKQKGCDFK
eukprot:gene26113-32644_t